MTDTMKKIIISLLFPILAGCCGNKQQPAILPQTSENDVAVAVDQLMNGFVNPDEGLLRSLTADGLVYGHSSGKVQNKTEFVAEILSRDPLVYRSIELFDPTIQMAGDAAVVRHIFTAETTNTNGDPGSLRIGVMQVWQLQNGKWKLLARQAYKL